MSTHELALCLALGLSLVLGFLAPGFPRPIPRSGEICLLLLALGTGAGVATGGLMLADSWQAVPTVATASLCLVFLAFWIAESPDAGGEEEGPGGSGGGGGGGPKVDPDPPPRVRPDGPSIDWDAFDREREGWTAPAPQPVGAR